MKAYGDTFPSKGEEDSAAGRRPTNRALTLYAGVEEEVDLDDDEDDIIDLDVMEVFAAVDDLKNSG